ncbi:hypothetical protein EBT16_03630 [bacterium]|nr:hypothetical protein [bacterium]
MISEKKKEYWVARHLTGDAGDNEIEKFLEVHGDLVERVVELMPRGMSSIGAAVAKCAIKYDRERAISFLRNSKDGIFEGKDDPVYHFYMWLHGLKGPKRKRQDVSTHEVALYACKQYCLGKKVKRLDRVKDIFKWAEGWTVS